MLVDRVRLVASRHAEIRKARAEERVGIDAMPVALQYHAISLPHRLHVANIPILRVAYPAVGDY